MKKRKVTRSAKPKIKDIKKLIATKIKLTEEPKKLKTPYNKSKLNLFRSLLLKRKETLKSNVTQIEEETTSKSNRDAAGDLSNLPIHIADMGSDTYEQDFNLGLLENEGEEIHEIDAALEKIDEKTYGLCEQCNTQIPEKRLSVIPYTRLCIQCKEKEESDS
jgi:RNA polymerase-binding protein DksA